MATITRRRWRGKGPTGRPAWREAGGYSAVVDGRQGRRYDSAWSREDAQEALAKRLVEGDAPAAPKVERSFGQLVAEYLAFKRATGKRSVFKDEFTCRALVRGLGAETPLTEITSQRIALYQRDRSVATSRHGRPLKPASINPRLAVARHMLRPGAEGGFLKPVPRV